MPICPYLTIWAYGHMGICEKNMGKWGIPEKGIKNAAQRCWIQVRRTLQSKIMAKNQFLDIFGLKMVIFPLAQTLTQKCGANDQIWR